MIVQKRSLTEILLRPSIRLIVPVGLILFCAAHLSDEWAALDREAIIAALCGIAPLTWLGALLAVMVAFLGVAGQERAVMTHLGHRINRRRGRIAAMATAAVSQTVGFGPLIGTIVRKRLLPELSVAQSAQISLLITAGFFAGIGLLWVMLQAAAAAGWAGLVAVPALAAPCLWLLARLPEAIARHLPAGWIMLRFLFWLTIDLGALAVSAWLVLPGGLRADMPLLEFLPLFLTALGAGLASGSPAGAGPFEAILMDGMADLPSNELAAGIIAFRLSAYALPAVVGAVVALLWPVLTPRGSPALRRPAAPVPTGIGPAGLRQLPRAEVQLALQGELELLRGADGSFWLQGQVPFCGVFLGDPVAGPGQTTAGRASLDAALDGAVERTGRQGRVPCLYRTGPRLAARARARGWVTQRIAQEAILDPCAFSTQGAARSGLRRKLRHAEQAGVEVTVASLLPIAEMAEVAAAWSVSHGGERGFSMGRFDPNSVRHQIVILARGRDGRLLAFVTFHGCAGEWVLDLIRCRPDCPDGTLYLAVVAAIGHAARAGVPRLSLAAVPEPDWGVTGRLGPAARRLSARARGLAQFKQAFRPRWEPRYIAAPTRTGLVCAALGIARAVHRSQSPARNRPPTCPQLEGHVTPTTVESKEVSIGGSRHYATE